MPETGSIAVTAASTTPLPGGGVRLRVVSEAGAFALDFPPGLGGALALTNRPGPNSDRPRGKGSRSQAVYEQIEAEAASDPRAYGAIKRACERHGVGRAGYYSWLYRP